MDELFRYEPDPDDPEWMIWEVLDRSRFNAVLEPVRVRRDADGRARCRMFPTQRHSNISDNLHGAALMGFVDVALFASTRAFGIYAAGAAVTLDCAVQFLSPGRIGEPLDAVTELLSETGRLVFLRGLIEQDDRRIAAFSATIRKISPRA